MEYALAGTCVFAKQSLDAILCDRFPLPLYGVTYHRHPFSRSYGDILPSSFSADHSSTLGFSPRLRVSVYGTVKMHTPLRGFSRRSALQPLAGSEDPFGIGARLSGRICLPGNAYLLASGHPSPDGCFAPASPLKVERSLHGTGILTRFPSPTPFGLGLGAD